MSRGQSSILNSLRTHLPHDARLLLAVSGGVDSVVLLHACREVARELRLHLEVAHLDHGLRGNSSDDARFVEGLVKSGALSFHLRNGIAGPPDENTESWGRRVRYEFFGELLSAHALEFIVTAHHADDVAETLLMRLLANKEPGEVARFDPRRRLIRPLLDITREQILSYAQQHSLQWREDSTNSDETFLRNKVRHTLIPVLREKFDSRIVEVLALRAQALAQDASALDAWAASETQRFSELEFGSRQWLEAVRAVLAALEPAVQWRLARDLISQKLGFPLGRLRAETFVAFLLGTAEGIELPSGLRLRRQEGGIRVVETT